MKRTAYYCDICKKHFKDPSTEMYTMEIRCPDKETTDKWINGIPQFRYNRVDICWSCRKAIDDVLISKEETFVKDVFPKSRTFKGDIVDND